MHGTEKSKIFDFFEFSQNESRSFDRASRTVWECSRRVLVMVIQMTRRAFSALRVIRIQGQMSPRVSLIFPYFLTRKMNITQNPCVRFAQEQFI